MHRRGALARPCPGGGQETVKTGRATSGIEVLRSTPRTYDAENASCCDSPRLVRNRSPGTRLYAGAPLRRAGLRRAHAGAAPGQQRARRGARRGRDAGTAAGGRRPGPGPARDGAADRRGRRHPDRQPGRARCAVVDGGRVRAAASSRRGGGQRPTCSAPPAPPARPRRAPPTDSSAPPPRCTWPGSRPSRSAGWRTSAERARRGAQDDGCGTTLGSRRADRRRGGTGSATPRPEDDQRHAEQADEGPDEVPPVGLEAVEQAPPEE
jgi:hypothetical protein